eukprot:c19156_g1_i1.p1 GENE.c19156_g1_i1~~c19156_g1_i1.p1  ORF type:complete len:458 (-),score=161.78 c19156_g1_i1:112-1485(-)
MKFNKATVAGVVGNILEWYDFAVFGYLAKEIGANFFPSDDQSTSLVETFSVYGGAFFARPLGGVFFGFIGDRYGRKRSLMISLLLMTICTFAMGCLPSHEVIGHAAPALLVILRLAQGFSVGGQLVGSFIYTIESAPPEKRAQTGALCLGTANLGSALGSGVAFVLHKSLGSKKVQEWGWRIPFLGGLVIGFASLYLQKIAEESVQFDEKKRSSLQSNKDVSPFMQLMKKHKKELFFGAANIMVSPCAFYLWYMWLPTFQTTLMRNPIPDDGVNFLLSAVFLFLSLPFLALFGWIADKYSIKFNSILGCVLITALSPPCLYLVTFGNIGLTILAYFLVTVAMALFGSVVACQLCMSFPVSIRFTAVGISYNIAQAIFGGTVSIIATELAAKDEISPSYYICGIGFINLICLIYVGYEERLNENYYSLYGRPRPQKANQVSAHISTPTQTYLQDDLLE